LTHFGASATAGSRRLYFRRRHYPSLREIGKLQLQRGVRRSTPKGYGPSYSKRISVRHADRGAEQQRMRDAAAAPSPRSPTVHERLRIEKTSEKFGMAVGVLRDSPMAESPAQLGLNAVGESCESFALKIPFIACSQARDIQLLVRSPHLRTSAYPGLFSRPLRVPGRRACPHGRVRSISPIDPPHVVPWHCPLYFCLGQ
jgi:hypothetical protein